MSRDIPERSVVGTEPAEASLPSDIGPLEPLRADASSFRSLKIGTTTVRKLRLVICTLCGCQIDTAGSSLVKNGCGFICKNDGLSLAKRDPNTLVVRVWERTDKLIEQRSYTRNDPTAGPTGQPSHSIQQESVLYDG